MAMATREEKMLEAATEMMLLRINEMKISLTNLLLRIEHDSQNITFPDVLDSFAVISGQMNVLMRLLKSDKVPHLKSLAVIPLALNPENDVNLQTVTEGRLPCFNHEVVPDYLRTKPDPEVEGRHTQVEMKASQSTPDALNKQAAQLTKLANQVLERITSAREEWENSERSGLPATTSLIDTQDLVSALQYGKNLRNVPEVIPRVGQIRPQAPAAPQPTTKGPAIKTTIRSAYPK